MNAHTNPRDFNPSLEGSSEPKETIFTLNDAHILRSKFIDRFAKIEIWASETSYSLYKDEQNYYNFSLNIKKLKDYNFKEEQTRLKQLLDELKPYIEFRGELAHSEIITETIKNETFILYKSARGSAHFLKKNYGYISFPDLRSAISKIQSIEAQLKNLILK